MLARWLTFLVWALAAASALAWGLQIFVRPPSTPTPAVVADTGTAVRGDLTRLLGVDAASALAQAAPEAAADARFRLVGVVSPRSPKAAREGLALIAVDGKPPRAYRVGAAVDGLHVLQGVDARGATLGPRGGAALIALKLPPPAPAATGVLPPATGPGASVVPSLPGGAALTAPRFGTPTRIAPATAAPEEPNDGEVPQPVEPLQPVPGGRATMR
ncbi:MAG: hypothetical protein Q8M01_17500 [Rubrivivax sp.]|nr:hypothetical protein [Rubrivivax sp.]